MEPRFFFLGGCGGIYIFEVNPFPRESMGLVTGIFTYIYLYHKNQQNCRWWQLKSFWNFHPETWGFMIQFDGCICFKRAGSTTNQQNGSVNMPLPVPWESVKIRAFLKDWPKIGLTYGRKSISLESIAGGNCVGDEG